MATSTGWGARPIKPQDRNLICPICLEQLKIPRSLTCLHSFCTKCLSSHVSKTGTTLSGINIFKCPVCRVEIHPPYDDAPLTSWADQFPIDIVLVSMLPGDKFIPDKTCEPCSVQGKKLKARYFCVECKEYRCQTCYEHHKSSKLLKDHRIFTLENSLSEPANVIALVDTLACTSHNNNEYEFFCSDHNIVLCATCLAEGHKDCTNCREINVHAKEVIKNQIPDKLLTKMNEVEKNLTDVSKRKHQTILDFEAEVKKQLDEISTMKQKINSIIDDLERRISEEGKKVSEKQSMKRLEEDTQIQSVVAAVKNSCKQLEAISKYGSEKQVCVIVHKMEDQLRAYQSKATDCSETTKIKIDIKIPDSIRKSSMLSVTDLSCKVLESRQTINPPYDRERFSDRGRKRREIVRVEEFKVNCPSNIMPPAYAAVDCLPDGRILFLDIANFRCSLYDSSYQYLSEYKLSSSPRRMTVVAKNEIAVSLPDQMKVQFLLIGKTITLKGSTSTTRWCTAFASLSNKELFFSGYEKDRYHWGLITTDGHEKSCFFIPGRDMTPSTGGTNVILNSLKTRVFVSCYLNNAVYCFALDGIKHFEYVSDKLKGPADMAIDMQENLFVVGHESCNIHQLSQNGSVLKVIADGIPQSPVSICITPSGSKILITSVDDINRDTCFVYQL